MWVAVVEAPQSYAELVEVWEQNSLKQDLSPAQRRAVNAPQKVRAKPEQLLTRPQLWATLDYATIENPDVQGNLECVVERNGTAHGILVWFDADLAKGVEFSNAPGAETIYWPVFFPWPTPVLLIAGQRVCVNLEAKLVEEDYVWRWTTLVDPPSATDAPIHFEQSSIQGEVISLQALQKQASDYVPHLSEEGRIERRTLEMIDGQASLEDIARRLAEEFPSRFARWQKALSYAGAVSQKFGE